jgi:putative hydrolase
MVGRPPQFFRYRDLRPAAINVDYQVHTVQTDGEATVVEILRRARQKGIAGIAFTEHVRRSTTWFPDFVELVRSASHAFPEIAIYVGCETKAMDQHGALDAGDEVLDASDLVLGSVHRFPDKHGGDKDTAVLSPDEFAELEFRLALGMIEYAPIHVLAHPGGMYQRRYGAFPEKYFRELMVASLDRKTAIEINSSYLVDLHAFIRLCEEVNPYVSIGSDAHRLEELGRCRDMLRMRGVALQ